MTSLARAQVVDNYAWPAALPRVEYGQIPDSLLHATGYPGEDGLDYYYNYKGVDIHFQVHKNSLIAFLTYLVRVKVLTDDGVKASVVDIPYYFDNDIEQILSIKGHTIQPNGNRIPLDTSRVRTIGVNSRYKLKEFQLPNVKVGSVLEYRYTIRRRYIEELPDFYFMNPRPTKLAVVRLVNSKFIRYEVSPVNMKQLPGTLVQKIDTSSALKIFTMPQPDSVIIDYWYMHNVPGLRDEPYISTLNDYRWQLKFIWKSFGNPRQVIGKSWDIVAAELRRNDGFTRHLQHYPSLNRMGGTFRRIGDPVARMDSIYRYVNDHAVYDGAESVLSSAPLDSVLSGRPSNQATINQVLMGMLGGGGITAEPLLTATRKQGRILSNFPSLYQFNVMMVYVRAGGRTFILDATQRHSLPDLLPMGTIGGKGLVVGPKSYEWVDISPERSRFKLRAGITARLTGGGDLIGHITAYNFGYLARKIRDQRTTDLTAAEIVRQDYLGRYTNTVIDSVRFDSVEAYGNPVRVSARFRIPGYAVSYKSGLEYSPLIIGYQMENPFGGSRHLPVTLTAPEEMSVDYRVRIPSGFTLPGSSNDVNMQIPGARLTFQYTGQSRMLHYHLDVAVVRTDFGRDLFPQLIGLYDRWVELSQMRLFIKSK